MAAPDLVALLRRISHEVNSTIVYQSDPRIYFNATMQTGAGTFVQVPWSTDDVWTLAPKAGDCEDYVITKKARLMALGYPASVLRIAVVTTKGIGRPSQHAVLTVHTTAGDYVLDSISDRVTRYPETPSPFIWIEIEQPSNGRMGWREVIR